MYERWDAKRCRMRTAELLDEQLFCDLYDTLKEITVEYDEPSPAELWDETAEAPVKEEEHKRTFASAVVNVAKVDAVVSLIRQLMEGKTKPKDVLMPVRAAMDAGVIRRPTWEEFCQEFGSYRLKSKTSFSDYTNPDKSPYAGADFQMMKEKFRQLMSEGQ